MFVAETGLTSGTEVIVLGHGNRQRTTHPSSWGPRWTRRSRARHEPKPDAPKVGVKKMDITSSGLVLVWAPALLVSEAAVGMAVWWRRPGALHRFAGGRLVAWLLRWRPLGMGALAGTWVALTVASWWCLFLCAYIAVNLLYFWLGMVGGWAAL